MIFVKNTVKNEAWLDLTYMLSQETDCHKTKENQKAGHHWSQ